MYFQNFRRALGITPKAAPLDTKSVSLTDSEALTLFGAIPTSSGISVSPTSALRVPAVACAVGLISETMGSLQPRLMIWHGWKRISALACWCVPSLRLDRASMRRRAMPLVKLHERTARCERGTTQPCDCACI
jgi:hypothetical protein